jgi:diguanylate cyclase (GGDEF)-like protein
MTAADDSDRSPAPAVDAQMAYLLPSLPGAIVPASVRRWSLLVLAVPPLVALVAPAAGWSSAAASLAVVPAFLFAYSRGWRYGLAVGATAMLLLWVGQHVAEVWGGPAVGLEGIAAASVGLVAVVGAGAWMGTRVSLEWTSGFEDEATGLPGRELVDAFLSQSMAAARRGHTLSVVLVGLDGWEDVAGEGDDVERDQVLTRVASVLLANTRDTDFVGRHGDGTFLVVTPGEPSFGVSVFADRIRRGVAELDDPSGRGYSVSAGVATYDRSITDGSELVARADDALTWARNLGGDKIIIHGRPAYREGPVRADYKAGHHRVN